MLKLGFSTFDFTFISFRRGGIPVYTPFYFYFRVVSCQYHFHSSVRGNLLHLSDRSGGPFYPELDTLDVLRGLSQLQGSLG